MRLLSYLAGVVMGGYLVYDVLHSDTLCILRDVITIALCAIINKNAR